MERARCVGSFGNIGLVFSEGQKHQACPPPPPQLLLLYFRSSGGLLTAVCCSGAVSGLTCWVRSWKAREMRCLCSRLLLVSTPTTAPWSTPEPR